MSPRSIIRPFQPCAVALGLLIVLLSVASAETFSEMYDRIVQGRDSKFRNSAIVAWSLAAAPVGKFLLIRKGSATCAVRFTSFHAGHDARPPTVFNSGEEHLYAEYDWYYQGDGSGDFTKPDIRKGHNKLARNPTIGIGRMAFQTGNTSVSCGPIELNWLYPDLIQMFSGTIMGDYGFELCPTKWDSISDVRSNDSALKCYRYDENRSPLVVYIGDL